MTNQMSYINPHYFSAILDGIGHRFILILECECVQGNEDFSPPRFSVGAINATRDPRVAQFKQLMEVGVKSANLQIPMGYLMAHQYIYLVHEGTDEHGWQYRSDWNTNIVNNFLKENDSWSAYPDPSHLVRRRVWMTTAVARTDLVRAKRLLSENLRLDAGTVRMQGELMRLEKSGSSQSWQKRNVTLFHNRLEFYYGNVKKGEVNLTDCEVKMLFEQQCPGTQFAFSIRNPIGSVGILLDAESHETRRLWVLAIQYQLAMNSYEVNFPPLEYGPPTGEYPDNRIFICSDLTIFNNVTNAFDARNFQLSNRELMYFEGEELAGRIFIEKSTIQDGEQLTFYVTSYSGIQFNLCAPDQATKALWLTGVRRQIQFIENQKMRARTAPREEMDDEDISVVDRICQFYDTNWTAPAVDGEDEDYLLRVFSAPSNDNPFNNEFYQEGHASAPKAPVVSSSPPSRNLRSGGSFSGGGSGGGRSNSAQSESFNDSDGGGNAGKGLVSKNSFAGSSFGSKTDLSVGSSVVGATTSVVTTTTTSTTASSQGKPSDSGSSTGYSEKKSLGLRTASSFINLHQTTSPKTTDIHRALINPKFVLSVLKSLTHRFVLVLECESRLPPSSGGRQSVNPVTVFPPRFTVGGARACRDPRITPLDQLLAISNKNPEIQLPTGWLMLHQYIHIVQHNTDDNGWQYRSDWSNGVVSAKDEQWVETCDEDKYVRRRLWMTTVVKKEDLLRAKKLVADGLDSTDHEEVILQGNLYVFQRDTIVAATGALPTGTQTFTKRRVALHHNRIELFVNADKQCEYSLVDCDVQILHGSQCPGRRYAFAVRNSNGSVDLIFDAESKETRLRWVRSITYQISIIAPEVNFSPFVYGPPTGELAENKILYAGELNKQNDFKKWMKYNFVLKPRELLFYNRDVLKGRLFLEGAVLLARDDDQDFTVKTASGLMLTVRADSMEIKKSWVRVIRFQIQYCANLALREANTPPSEREDPLSGRERRRLYNDDNWVAPEEDDSEDNVYMQSLVTAMSKNRYEILDEAEDGLLSSSTSNVSSNSIRTFEDETYKGAPTSPLTSISERKTLVQAQQAQAQHNPQHLSLYGGVLSGDVKDDKKFQYVHWERYPLFNFSLHKSLMVSHLPAELFYVLNKRETTKHYTLSNMIMNGVLNPDNNLIGINVGDAQCYALYAELLNPIISVLHNRYDAGSMKHLSNMNASGIVMSSKSKLLFEENVSFVRINCTRNFANYSMLCGMTETERVECEAMLYKLFSLFRDEHSGEYFKLDHLTQIQKEFLDDCSFLFEVPVERYITTGTGSGSDRAYPHNRGIFVNTARDVFIWVNDEEHMRLIVTNPSGDILDTFKSFVVLHNLIETNAIKLGTSYMRNDSVGYCSSNLAFLGTGMKLSCMVYLPQFNKLITDALNSHNNHPSTVSALTLLEDVCALFQLTSRGSAGVNSVADGDKFDICNTEYLGVSEVMVVSKVIAGVTSLIEFDLLLANGATVAEIREVMTKPKTPNVAKMPTVVTGGGSFGGSANQASNSMQLESPKSSPSSFAAKSVELSANSPMPPASPSIALGAKRASLSSHNNSAGSSGGNIKVEALAASASASERTEGVSSSGSTFVSETVSSKSTQQVNVSVVSSEQNTVHQQAVQSSFTSSTQQVQQQHQVQQSSFSSATFSTSSKSSSTVVNSSVSSTTASSNAFVGNSQSFATQNASASDKSRYSVEELSSDSDGEAANFSAKFKKPAVSVNVAPAVVQSSSSSATAASENKPSTAATPRSALMAKYASLSDSSDDEDDYSRKPSAAVPANKAPVAAAPAVESGEKKSVEVSSSVVVEPASVLKSAVQLETSEPVQQQNSQVNSFQTSVTSSPVTPAASSAAVVTSTVTTAPTSDSNKPAPLVPQKSKLLSLFSDFADAEVADSDKSIQDASYFSSAFQNDDDEEQEQLDRAASGRGTYTGRRGGDNSEATVAAAGPSSGQFEFKTQDNVFHGKSTRGEDSTASVETAPVASAEQTSSISSSGGAKNAWNFALNNAVENNVSVTTNNVVLSNNVTNNTTVVTNNVVTNSVVTSNVTSNVTKNVTTTNSTVNNRTDNTAISSTGVTLRHVEAEDRGPVGYNHLFNVHLQDIGNIDHNTGEVIQPHLKEEQEEIQESIESSKHVPIVKLRSVASNGQLNETDSATSSRLVALRPTELRGDDDEATPVDDTPRLMVKLRSTGLLPTTPGVNSGGSGNFSPNSEAPIQPFSPKGGAPSPMVRSSTSSDYKPPPSFIPKATPSDAAQRPQSLYRLKSTTTPGDAAQKSPVPRSDPTESGLSPILSAVKLRPTGKLLNNGQVANDNSTPSQSASRPAAQMVKLRSVAKAGDGEKLEF